MHRQGQSRAFVLGELIIVIVISSLVVASLLAALVALVRALQPQAVTIGGEVMPIAPTFGAMPSAVRLHQAFVERCTAARAIYVFGGSHLGIPATAPTAKVQPLRCMALPQIDDFTPGLPMDAASFYERYATALGEQESVSTTADFTVITVGPDGEQRSLAISCLAQVRRRSVTISDGVAPSTYTVREVRLWEPGVTASQRYAFAEPTAVTTSVFVGAVHSWHRYRPATGEGEEGPACVAFPDPWVFVGGRGRSDDIPPFSRFIYFLPVSR